MDATAVFFNNLKGFDEVLPGGSLNTQFCERVFYMRRGARVISLHKLCDAEEFTLFSTFTTERNPASWTRDENRLTAYYYTVGGWVCGCVREGEAQGEE